MSTQTAVRPGAKAAPRAAVLAFAGWIWLGCVAAAGFGAVAFGGNPRDVAWASALAIAPGLIGFILLPWLRHRWAGFGFISAWTVAAAGLVAGAGGAGSPLAVMLLLGPALALVLGRWTVIAGAGAVAGYAIGYWLAPLDPGSAIGPFAGLLSAGALALIAWLLVAAQRSAAGSASVVGARVAEVSHELRTPLTHILGFSEMIERRVFGEVSDRYVEYAGLIRKSGTHLLGLVNDLLDLSRIEAGRFELLRERFDVRTVIEEVVRLSIDSAARKQISLGMLTPDAPLNVEADDRAVKRMLINTIGNAIKFTPEGGRVMVQAAAIDGALRLDTIDNGPGIPEAERTKLGQAYERGSGGARAEGAGLGLSLVRALAGLHGGALSFHDAPGGGALVRITLPVLTA
ncbi:MAG: sensor histidine kinase [Hyphomonadaceae bacterium]